MRKSFLILLLGFFVVFFITSPVSEAKSPYLKTDKAITWTLKDKNTIILNSKKEALGEVKLKTKVNKYSKIEIDSMNRLQRGSTIKVNNFPATVKSITIYEKGKVSLAKKKERHHLYRSYTF